MKLKILLTILGLLSTQIIFAQANKIAPTEFSYSIVPVSLADRAILEIEVEFTGDSSGVTQISLPVDRYGTRNIYESVSTFSVMNATATAVFEKPHIRNLHHDPGEKITVNYTIAFDPEMSTTSSFSPIIEPEIFHFFYPQWTLRLEDENKAYMYQIEFENLPNGWIAVSNLPQNDNGTYYITAPQKDFKPFIAGGNYDHYELDIEGNPVNVIISYHFREENLLDDVQTLLRFQRNFFDFEANQNYLVSITYRKSILAGTGIENAFITLMRKGAEKYDVLQLLAHETMHNWVPLMADIYRDEDEVGSEFKTEFFNEGFTSYAPKVLLHDENLITKEEVVFLLNETLLDYATNSHNSITFEDMQKAVAQGEFNNMHEKVSYYRGDLLAFKWDNRIREYTNGQENILHFIRKVIAKALEENGKIQFPDFFDIASDYGIDAEDDWVNHISNGELIVIKDLGWLSKDHKIVWETRTFYDAGFSARQSERAGIVEGVIDDGIAFAAGLRNGMKIIEMTRSESKDEAMVVVINKNGSEETIRYFPSKEITYQQIVKG